MPVTKNIREELEELAPGFLWPENHPGFEVPEGYFHAVPGQVWDKIRLPAAKEIPGEFSKQNTYDIPDGYFDRLPQTLLEKIKKDTPVIRRLPRRHSNWHIWASAAAIAAIVAVGGLLWLPQSSRRPTLDQQLANLSDNAIEQYLGTEINAFNTNGIYSNLSESGLQNTWTNGLSNDDIEEYLNDDMPNSAY